MLCALTFLGPSGNIEGLFLCNSVQIKKFQYPEANVRIAAKDAEKEVFSLCHLLNHESAFYVFDNGGN